MENAEQQSNKYNSRKDWDTSVEDVERGLQGANDSLAYVKEKKVAYSGNPATSVDVAEEEVKQVEEVEATSEPSEETESKYKKVDWKKRYDDMKRHYDRRLNEWKQEKTQLKAEMRANAPKYTAPKTVDELKEFREENPEFYDIAESIAHLRATEEVSELRAELDSMKEKLQTTSYEKAMSELKMLVPDIDEIQANESFHEWAEQQPQEIQNWIYNNPDNAQLAARAIKLYKAEMGMTPSPQKPKPTPKVEEPDATEAVSVKSKPEPSDTGKKIWTTSEIERLSVGQYDKLAAEIDQAFLEGRVVRG